MLADLTDLSITAWTLGERSRHAPQCHDWILRTTPLDAGGGDRSGPPTGAPSVAGEPALPALLLHSAFSETSWSEWLTLTRRTDTMRAIQGRPAALTVSRAIRGTPVFPPYAPGPLVRNWRGQASCSAARELRG